MASNRKLEALARRLEREFNDHNLTLDEAEKVVKIALQARWDANAKLEEELEPGASAAARARAEKRIYNMLRYPRRRALDDRRRRQA